ncbi:family 16 glycosylhydrolase [Nocardia sp. NPDC052566]|uniref:glycoside hydrolase family 16 protein n=1 Tax=Nocardia sp. NPDC052566 TaxID=3364330 RepID=UPI0037C7E40D
METGRFGRAMGAVAAAVLLAVVTACASETAAAEQDSRPTQWKLVWSDEFTGRAGERPDPGKWVYDRGGEPQWGNAEWQYYTDRPENVSLDGQGHLAITARRERLPGMTPCPHGPCDITSGRITTRDKLSRAYGRYEASMKIPDGKGLWPAFWMMGADIDQHPWPANGEIDVMETVGDDPGLVHGSAHGPGFVDPGFTDSYQLPDGQRLADAFHTYAVEWSPHRIDWLLDDTRYFSLSKDQLTADQKWVFDHRFYLLLNLAVGGGWPGPPDQSTRFPAELLVDYVRVYARVS